MFEDTALGRLLNGGQMAPPGAPGTREANPLASVQGAPQAGPRESGLKSLLSNPAVMAALAQSATSMLGKRGIGPSIGDAFGAAGRAMTTLEKSKQAQEKQIYERGQDRIANERADAALKLRERGAARTGAKATKNSDILFKMLMDAANTEYKAKAGAVLDPTDPGPTPPDPLLIRQEAEQIAALSPEDSATYLEVRRERGAEGAQLYLQWVQQGKPSAQKEPVQPVLPSNPELPPLPPLELSVPTNTNPNAGGSTVTPTMRSLVPQLNSLFGK